MLERWLHGQNMCCARLVTLCPRSPGKSQMCSEAHTCSLCVSAARSRGSPEASCRQQQRAKTPASHTVEGEERSFHFSCTMWDTHLHMPHNFKDRDCSAVKSSFCFWRAPVWFPVLPRKPHA